MTRKNLDFQNLIIPESLILRYAVPYSEEEVSFLPEVSERISSEDNLSFVTIYILVNPSGPGGEGFFVGFHHLETWIHIITFLIIVHSVALTRKKNSNVIDKRNG